MHPHSSPDKREREGGRVLLVDHYDSYTFNLFQLLCGVFGEEPVVVQHDHAGSLEELVEAARHRVHCNFSRTGVTQRARGRGH